MAILNVLRVRPLFAALAAVAVAAAGCGNSGIPSGAISKAAGTRALTVPGNTGGTGTGGGGGGGGGGTGIRIVAWDLNKTLPTGGTTQQIWMFGLAQSGTLTAPTVKKNGTALTPAPQVQQIQGGGFFVDFGSTQLASGDKIQVSDGATSSNEITVSTAAPPAGNSPPAFKTNSPLDITQTQQTYPAATPFDFGAAAQANSYNLVCMLIDAPQSGITIKGIPISVELPGAVAFTAGSNTGASNVFTNATLPAIASQTEIYAWHVVPLDATGWGIGTTSNLTALDETWPWFLTQ